MNALFWGISFWLARSEFRARIPTFSRSYLKYWTLGEEDAHIEGRELLFLAVLDLCILLDILVDVPVLL